VTRHLFEKCDEKLLKLEYWEDFKYVPCEPIPYEEAEDVFSDFLDWIDQLKSEKGDKVRLISHGMINFHARVLVIKQML
jgi:hypothetical protein